LKANELDYEEFQQRFNDFIEKENFEPIEDDGRLSPFTKFLTE